MRGDDHGVYGALGHGAVATGAVYGDTQRGCRRHGQAGLVAHGARQARHVVLAQHHVGPRKALVQTVVQHGAGTAKEFVGGLAHPHHGAAPALAHAHEHVGRANQAAAVQVVAAGVHDGHLLATRVLGRDLARKVQAGVLLDGQRVGVAAQHDGGPLAVAQQAHHAGAAHLGTDLVAQLLQLARQARAGLVLLERQLGHAVQVLVQRIDCVQAGLHLLAHLVGERGDG